MQQGELDSFVLATSYVSGGGALKHGALSSPSPSPFLTMGVAEMNLAMLRDHQGIPVEGLMTLRELPNSTTIAPQGATFPLSLLGHFRQMK